MAQGSGSEAKKAWAALWNFVSQKIWAVKNREQMKNKNQKK